MRHPIVPTFSLLLGAGVSVLLLLGACVPDQPPGLQDPADGHSLGTDQDPSDVDPGQDAAQGQHAGGHTDMNHQEEGAHDHGEAPSDLSQVGRVEFPVSCSPGAVSRFETGVAMFHSFWFPQADSAFQAALEADPGCAMAEWGRAMAQMGNPYAGSIPEARRRTALEALDRAAALEPPTDREQGYIQGARLLFDDQVGSEFERRRAWETAMEELHATYPDDPEAGVFLGLALLANAPPDDTTFVRQLRAAEILEELFQDQPGHPGLAHYIIHAYDTPILADRGLDAALSYADIAPDAPHAQHMPSHIFTRLGMWEHSIEANLRSADASGSDWARVHPWDYLVYAYLQQGRDREAARIVEQAEAAAALAPSPAAAERAYNWQAMPARLTLEREDWAEAAQLEIRGTDPHQAIAIRHFARGVGMARIGELDGARREQETLERIQEALEEEGEGYWARIVEAQALAVSAWIEAGQGDLARGVALADEAATLEELAEKHPVTPGPILPAREMHGELLLLAQRPQEALEVFNRVLEREPNRARATFYAARAAEASGELAAAEQFRSAYRELTAQGDGSRSWDQEAR
jgi:hypothetical protein